MVEPYTNQHRVVNLAPIGKDARLIHTVLSQAGMDCVNCTNLEEVIGELAEEPGALVLTEEALRGPLTDRLLEVLHTQPPWSDLPVVVLTHHGTNSPTAARVLETFRNAVLLERPLRIPILVSTIRAALRSRQRQYEVRAHLRSLERQQLELRELITRRDELYAERQGMHERLEQVLASISDGFMTLDSEWRFVTVNDRAAHNAGLRREQMIGRCIWDVFVRAFRGEWKQRAEQALRTQQPDTFEYRDMRLGRWFEYRIYPSGGGLSIFEVDVNERKLADIRQQLLVELNDAIRPLQEPKEVMWAAGSIVAKHFDVPRAFIGEVVGDGYVTADQEYSQALGNAATTPRLHAFPAALLRLLAAGTPVVLADPEQDTWQLSAEERAGLGGGAILAVPLFKHESLAAFFALFAEGPRRWTDDELALLEQVAQRTLLGIENAQAQKALRENEEQLELAIAGSHGGLVDARLQPGGWRNFLDSAFISSQSKAFLGFKDDELPSTVSAWWQRVHPGDKPRLMRLLYRHYHGKKAFFVAEYRMLHRDGSVRWLQSRHRVRRDEKGNPVRWVGIDWDVTEQKQWEEELEQATQAARQRAAEAERGQRVMQALMENVPEGIAIADGSPDYQIHTVSTYGARLLGAKLETGGWALDSGPLAERLLRDGKKRPSPEDLPLHRAVHLGELVVNQEWILERPNGEQVPLLCNAGPIRDAEGKLAGGVLTWRDITDRKLVEEQLRELNDTLEQRVQERTLALLRHRERLRAMASQLSSAEQRERRRLAADLHDYLAQLLVVCRMKLGTACTMTDEDGLTRLLREMDDMLDQSLTYTRTLVSRLSPTILYEAGLSAAVRWLAEQLGREGLRVRLEGEEEVALSDDTAILLFQSIRELLYNIIKHARVSSAVVRLKREDHQFWVEVLDKGVGFNTEETLHAPSGNGQFGLFNVRERIEALGGSFTMKSVPGRGTRVRLCIPVSRAPAKRSAQPAVNVTPVPARQAREKKEGVVRILLVDDHSIVRDGLRHVLEAQAEFRVVGEAANGEEAIEQAHHLNPDIVVMDVNMPRMNGIEATRQIKAALPHISVVALSLEDSQEVMDAMRRAGATAFVNKNGPAAEFCKVLARVHRVET